jgi:hypothetical protein
MAAVDYLLQIAREQRADALVLRTGEAPVLVRGQSERKLSMPDLDDEVIRMFVSEISGEDEVIEVGTAELLHDCVAGAFKVMVQVNRGELVVSFAATDRTPAKPTATPTPACTGSVETRP